MTAGAPDTGMLAQIFSKLGSMGEQLATITEQLKQVPDHETRIRKLEQFRFTLAGFSIVGGTAAGAIGYWIGHLVGK